MVEKQGVDNTHARKTVGSQQLALCSLVCLKDLLFLCFLKVFTSLVGFKDRLIENFDLSLFRIRVLIDFRPHFVCVFVLMFNLHLDHINLLVKENQVWQLRDTRAFIKKMVDDVRGRQSV